VRVAEAAVGAKFQSAPGDEAGRNLPLRWLPLRRRGFNPLPAMKPGGTCLAVGR